MEVKKKCWLPFVRIKKTVLTTIYTQKYPGMANRSVSSGKDLHKINKKVNQEFEDLIMYNATFMTQTLPLTIAIPFTGMIQKYILK